MTKVLERSTESDKPYPVYVGFICAIVAVILYGSNFVPVKKYYTGDGMFFQFVLCNGIFLVGIVIQLIQNSKFFPLVMVGGAIWATGNLCVVPIIKTIGMGLGISLWGTVALVAGWASGNDSQEVLVFKKTPIQDGSNRQVQGLHRDDDRLFIEDLPPRAKKLIGYALCLFSGICYGLNFVPSIYVQDNYGHKGATKNGLDYVFAQFCGIYLAGAVYFYIYCLIKKNSPKVYPQAILPGFLSGILWAIATACWFVANAELSESVSFPIVSTGPSAIALLFWGVIIFKEVKGVRNIAILVFGFLVMTAGAIMAGFSR
ncbi:transmembrane protein 144 [Elysia marginata]|uniref:Transmembrane protein 144 n=1 Tax=Elysia marginata TaxID=1093978 RepID=A0AAV4GZ21_9GAST|nr:transmembrane protein 144 [Elysia marginata]